MLDRRLDELLFGGGFNWRGGQGADAATSEGLTPGCLAKFNAHSEPAGLATHLDELMECVAAMRAIRDVQMSSQACALQSALPPPASALAQSGRPAYLVLPAPPFSQRPRQRPRATRRARFQDLPGAVASCFYSTRLIGCRQSRR